MVWVVGRDRACLPVSGGRRPKIRDAGGEGNPCHAGSGAGCSDKLRKARRGVGRTVRNGYSVEATRGSTREKEKPPREHKPITLLQFNSKFGDVKVQPVFGRVNGAQLSLGF